MTPRGGPTLDFSLFGRYFLDLAVFYPGAFLCLAPLWEHVKAPRRTAVLTAALVTVICLAAAALCAIFELDSNILLLPTLLAAFWLLRWRVNLLTVSEAEARSMGVDTTRLRVVVVLCATLMTAGSVAISGMIGWVGLVIPHFGRMIFGQDYRRLLPASSLLGATFLMVVDNLARTITTSEIPLGILTSFVGAPVFLYLILSGGTQRGD